MKKVIKIAGILTLNIVLVVVALVLLRYLLIPAIVITAFISFFRRSVGSGFTNISDYLRSVALTTDQSGNVICADLFNLVLITTEGYKFGNPDETISSVLGKNKVKGTLSKVGIILDKILNFFDKGHSINSIEQDEN